MTLPSLDRHNTDAEQTVLFAALGYWSEPEVEAAIPVIDRVRAEVLAKFEVTDLIVFQWSDFDPCTPIVNYLASG